MKQEALVQYRYLTGTGTVKTAPFQAYSQVQQSHETAIEKGDPAGDVAAAMFAGSLLIVLVVLILLKSFFAGDVEQHEERK